MLLDRSGWRVMKSISSAGRFRKESETREIELLETVIRRCETESSRVMFESSDTAVATVEVRHHHAVGAGHAASYTTLSRLCRLVAAAEIADRSCKTNICCR